MPDDKQRPKDETVKPALGGRSVEARRPQIKPPAYKGGDSCPNCKTGQLEVIDDMLLSCDECGFDIVFPTTT